MNKKLVYTIISLIIFSIVIVAVGLTLSDFNKSTKLNGTRILKIDVKQLQPHGAAPKSIMTLEDAKSIKIVLNAINNAEGTGFKVIPTYEKYGTSSHLLELYDKDNNKQNYYIALGPKNDVTACVKEGGSVLYRILENDTIYLRELLLK